MRDPYYSSPAMRVAYAIARVIAEKTIEDDAKLRTLDGLGKAAALHEMARRMQPELLQEAAAAYAEACKILEEETQQEICDDDAA